MSNSKSDLFLRNYIRNTTYRRIASTSWRSQSYSREATEVAPGGGAVMELQSFPSAVPEMLRAAPHGDQRGAAEPEGRLSEAQLRTVPWGSLQNPLTVGG